SSLLFCAFCFHTAPSAALYPLSLHDALPICLAVERSVARPAPARSVADVVLERALELEAAVLVPVAIEAVALAAPELAFVMDLRSEEHTSELQSRENLVCRLLLEQKKSPNAR